MNKSKIGYYTIGPDGKPTHEYRAWNPFGYGCSAGCPGCWARQLAKRVGGAGCEKCREFVPHIHPERMGDPAKRKKPSLVLCNFTNDWMDEGRPDEHVAAILDVMECNLQHTCVTLTKNAHRLSGWLEGVSANEWPDNWHHGLTIRNQAEADAKLPDFLSVPGNLWISNEPAQGEVNWDLCQEYPDEYGCYVDARHRIRGLICGHDNRRGAPGTETLAHIRSTVEQCKAAGVNCFVKQLWDVRCPACNQGPLEPLGSYVSPFCRECGSTNRWKLLRASHPPEYALYPDWAKDNRLPWEAVT